MDTKKIKTAFTEAVLELEAETKSRQFPDNITTEEAAKHVDHDVVVAWAMAALGLRSPQQLLSDILENLTDADATSIINCLLNETDTARKIMAKQLCEYVAKDLAYEAQKRVDYYDPTDAEVSRTSYAVEVDDPIIGDLRHLARQYK
jgi:hypothetical protein